MWITWKKELLHYAFILEGLKVLLKTKDVINLANLMITRLSAPYWLVSISG